MTDRGAGRKAWLITWDEAWEGARAEAGIADPIAAVLSPRVGAGRVRWLTEQLYMASAYTAAERAAIATGQRENPYPAQWGSPHGVPWEGQVVCGHNPYLFARRVLNLRLRLPDSITWEETRLPR